MSEKGTTMQQRECATRAIDGYPGAIPAFGMVSLLAGTDDDTDRNWQKWAGMVWDYLQTGEKWKSSQTQRVHLVITAIEPAEAARWLTVHGERRETLSEQVLLWLGDYLDNPGKPRQHVQRRLELLKQVIEQLKANDPSLDTEAMPGTRGDLLELCQRLHPAAFAISEKTLKGELRGICSFPPSGARKSSYYRDQLPKLS
jgi:hypothetical protein